MHHLGVRLNPSLYNLPAEGWDQFRTHMTVSEYKRPHQAERFAFPRQGGLWSLAGDRGIQARTATAAQICAEVKQAEATRVGPAMSDIMTCRGSEMSCVLSFGQLNGLNLFARFVADELHRHHDQAGIFELLEEAELTQDMTFDTFLAEVFEGARVGFGDDLLT
eukprot:1784511-Amphidinium_carterae.1